MTIKHAVVVKSESHARRRASVVFRWALSKDATAGCLAEMDFRSCC